MPWLSDRRELRRPVRARAPRHAFNRARVDVGGGVPDPLALQHRFVMHGIGSASDRQKVRSALAREPRKDLALHVAPVGKPAEALPGDSLAHGVRQQRFGTGRVQYQRNVPRMRTKRISVLQGRYCMPFMMGDGSWSWRLLRGRVPLLRQRICSPRPLCFAPLQRGRRVP